MKEVGDFVYLGAIFSNKGGANKDMQYWLAKAKSSFGRLKIFWSSKQYSKIKMYNTLVKSVFLYSSKTWKINITDNENLDSF